MGRCRKKVIYQNTYLRVVLQILEMITRKKRKIE